MSSMIENFDSLARLLLEALLNTLWQGMLIAALVWLLLRLTKRVSATTRHAVWLVTLLTIGTLPLVAVIANRNVPATNPAPPVKQETTAPAVQTATPTAAPEADRLADPFSLDRQLSRFNSPASQVQPIISYDFKPAPQLLGRGVEQGPERLPEPRFAAPRLDSNTRATTLQELSRGILTATTASSNASPGTSSGMGSETLWRRAQS